MGRAPFVEAAVVRNRDLCAVGAVIPRRRHQKEPPNRLDTRRSSRRRAWQHRCRPPHSLRTLAEPVASEIRVHFRRGGPRRSTTGWRRLAKTLRDRARSIARATPRDRERAVRPEAMPSAICLNSIPLSAFYTFQRRHPNLSGSSRRVCVQALHLCSRTPGVHLTSAGDNRSVIAVESAATRQLSRMGRSAFSSCCAKAWRSTMSWS